MEQKILVIKGENPMADLNLREYLSNGWIIKTIAGSCCYLQLSGLLIITHVLIERHQAKNYVKVHKETSKESFENIRKQNEAACKEIENLKKQIYEKYSIFKDDMGTTQ